MWLTATDIRGNTGQRLDQRCITVIGIANKYSLDQAREALKQRTEVLDVLFNNAGIGGETLQNFVSGFIENVRLIFDTNCSL